MARSPSPEPVAEPDRVRLLDLAEASIHAGLDGQPALIPGLDEITPALQRPAGAFVTLTVDGALNGCIGTIEPREPLGQAVPRLAWSAAFADPRLPALSIHDIGGLDIEVSVLSLLSAMGVGSRAELIAVLRPGTDGLVIAASGHQAVFLPSVWAQLPSPDDFIDHLYRKAGLRPGGWPEEMTASRFTVVKFRRPARTVAGSRSLLGETGEAAYE